MDKILTLSLSMLHFIETYKGVFIGTVLVILLVTESIFKLRKRVQSRLRRIWINVVLAVPALLLARLLLSPIVIGLAYKNQSWHWGLNYAFDAPIWLKSTLAFLLLDYSMYWWHVLMHRWPLLWRFHLVHHADLDMDVTTAFRFHFGEMVGSVIFRSLLVMVLGISPIMLLFYEFIFQIEVLFHHSNIRLPIKMERLLSKVIVTPRMHGLHHSVLKTEADSNFSSVLNVWDRLHRTFSPQLDKPDICIGVPAYANEHELTIGKLLKMPFTKIRDWEEREAPKV